MRERPMIKMFKFAVAALTAATLAASTPAGATHSPNGPNISGDIPVAGRLFHYTAAVTYPGPQMAFSFDGGSTYLNTNTAAQYFAGEDDPAQDNGDGPKAGTFRVSWAGSPWSIDGGSTWTNSEQQYYAGEHDPAQDNGDGPGAGTFRRRAVGSAWGSLSSDGGSTWSYNFEPPQAGLQALTAFLTWYRGETDPTQDNGDGPGAGTFQWRSTAPEYSINGGSTWTATKEQYDVGETDPALDNGDGPGAGTFRSQDAMLIVHWCLLRRGGPNHEATAQRLRATGEIWGPFITTLNNLGSRPCSGPQREGSNTYTWNEDDGIEPTGDWCVSGRTPADISMICRGEGYTYREARRELGFGLGRP